MTSLSGYRIMCLRVMGQRFGWRVLQRELGTSSMRSSGDHGGMSQDSRRSSFLGLYSQSIRLNSQRRKQTRTCF